MLNANIAALGEQKNKTQSLHALEPSLLTASRALFLLVPGSHQIWAHLGTDQPDHCSARDQLHQQPVVGVYRVAVIQRADKGDQSADKGDANKVFRQVEKKNGAKKD